MVTVGTIGLKHGALGRGVAVNVGRHYGAYGLREIGALRFDFEAVDACKISMARARVRLRARVRALHKRERDRGDNEVEGGGKG